MVIQPTPIVYKMNNDYSIPRIWLVVLLIDFAHSPSPMAIERYWFYLFASFIVRVQITSTLIKCLDNELTFRLRGISKRNMVPVSDCALCSEILVWADWRNNTIDWLYRQILLDSGMCALMEGVKLLLLVGWLARCIVTVALAVVVE